jgi:hypothetical protein
MKFRQPTTMNVQKVCLRGTIMLQGNKICDVTLELIFNGVLPHKCDAPYNNNYMYSKLLLVLPQHTKLTYL